MSLKLDLDLCGSQVRILFLEISEWVCKNRNYFRVFWSFLIVLKKKSHVRELILQFFPKSFPSSIIVASWIITLNVYLHIFVLLPTLLIYLRFFHYSIYRLLKKTRRLLRTWFGSLWENANPILKKPGKLEEIPAAFFYFTLQCFQFVYKVYTLARWQLP